MTLQTGSTSVGNFVSFLLLNSSVLTCSLFKCRQRWFIYIVVDSGRVGVVTDEQQVTDVWVIWILPECQTEPGHQNSLSITKWKNWKWFWVSKCCGLPVEWLFWQTEEWLLLVNKWLIYSQCHNADGSSVCYPEDWLRIQLMCCQPLRANRV